MFERASIVKLTRDYHDKMCTDSSECVVFEADIKKKFIEVEVSANLSANLFSLPYYFYNDFSNERTLTAILPGLNIDAELYSPRVNRNVGFIVGVGSRLLDSHNSFYFMNNGINTFYQYYAKANVFTVHLGLIPEIIGRLPVLTYLNPLDRDALRKILVEPKNSIVKQYMKLFEMDGIKLSFTEEALDFMVDKAVEYKLGARGLRSIVEAVMTDAMFEVPSKKIKKFIS